MKPGPTDRRRELLLILALTALGAIARGWGFGRLGLDHFDEGIYAIGAQRLLFPPRGGPWIEPSIAAYAPPGFPVLVAVCYFLLGVSDRSAIFVSWLAGTLTIPLTAWLGRRWIGPGAGACAAGLVALAGPHVVFSRMALTDASHLLAWIAALGLGVWFLERPSLLRALPFGLMVGLAQLLKYSGWVTGAVVAAAALNGLFSTDEDQRTRSRRALFLGLLAALAAGLVYWPWYQFVDRHGGYASLLAHHRGYVDGFSAWPSNWRQQMAQAVALSGLAWGFVPWTALAWLIACASAAFCSKAHRWRISTAAPLLALLLVTTAVAPEFPWWLGMFALPCLLRSVSPADRVLAWWWILLSVLTPLYHPYARLWLPLHAVGWLLSARALSLLSTLESRPGVRFKALRHQLASALLLALAVHLALLRTSEPLANLLRPTDGLRLAAGELARGPLASNGPRRSLSLGVLSRPSFRFYLIQQGLGFQILESQDQLPQSPRPGPWLIVDEAQALGWPGDRLGAKVVAVSPVAPATLLDLEPSAAFGKWTIGLPTPDRMEEASGRPASDEAAARLWLLGETP